MYSIHFVVHNQKFSKAVITGSGVRLSQLKLKEARNYDSSCHLKNLFSCILGLKGSLIGSKDIVMKIC